VLVNYIRLYGDPGLELEALTEIADLMSRDVIRIPEKQPVIGNNIFATQAGLHQTGMQRQGEAEGGLIYLPIDPAVIGRREVEMSRIGALSGIDGIVSLLNQERQAAGDTRPKLTGTSRLVKRVYDGVHEAYNGRYDAASDRWLDYRTTFFQPSDLAALAAQYEAESA